MFLYRIHYFHHWKRFFMSKFEFIQKSPKFCGKRPLHSLVPMIISGKSRLIYGPTRWKNLSTINISFPFNNPADTATKWALSLQTRIKHAK